MVVCYNQSLCEHREACRRGRTHIRGQCRPPAMPRLQAASGKHLPRAGHVSLKWNEMSQENSYGTDTSSHVPKQISNHSAGFPPSTVNSWEGNRTPQQGTVPAALTIYALINFPHQDFPTLNLITPICLMDTGSDLFQFWLTVVKAVVRELALPANKGSPGERAEQNAGVASSPPH